VVVEVSLIIAGYGYVLAVTERVTTARNCRVFPFAFDSSVRSLRWTGLVATIPTRSAGPQ
jgi:hypothetical protein